MASLEQGSVAGLSVPAEDGKEFNQYTLTGELHQTFLDLLIFVEHDLNKDSDVATITKRFRTHIERGVSVLSARVKTPEDFLSLIV